jgi:uncharacterized protein (TIGR03083 family)
VVVMVGDARVDEGLRRLRAESDALCAELEALAPEDWERPTNCEPWTIRVLVAHVVRSAEGYLASLERGLRGDLEPAMTREQRAQRMREIAAREPATILADLRAITDRFEREFGGLRPEQLDTLAAHAYGPRPARWFVEQRLAEIAFHRWDALHSLGRPADLDRGTAAFLLPMLLEQNLPAMMGSDGPTGHGSFRLAVRGDPDSAWQAVAAPGSVAVTRDSGNPSDVAIEGDAVALALLIYGRRSLAELERAGRLTVGGDRDVADRFNQIFRGP